MAGIFTRKALQTIMADENLTPEERTDQIFSLYGRALDDGYVTKSASQAAAEQALNDFKATIKEPEPVVIKDTEEYKQLRSEFDGYKAKQSLKESDDFKAVKPKFFDAVYGKLDHGEKHKPYGEQLAEIKKDYEEFFTEQPTGAPKYPQFGGEPKGQIPDGDAPSFKSIWGFDKYDKK